MCKGAARRHGVSAIASRSLLLASPFLLLFSAGAAAAQATSYADSAKRFSVLVPQGWTTLDSGLQGVRISGDGLAFVIRPSTREAPEEELAALVQHLSGTWRGLREMDRRYISSKDQHGIWAEFDGTDSTGASGRVRVLGIRGGGVTAGVIVNGERSTYLRERGAIEAVLSTLRLGTNPPVVIVTPAPAMVSARSDSTVPGTTAAEDEPEVTIGLIVRDVSAADDIATPLDEGVIVDRVAIGSSADKAGIRAGDIILQINHASIEEAADFNSTIADHAVGDVLELLITRNGRKRPVQVRVE